MGPVRVDRYEIEIPSSGDPLLVLANRAQGVVARIRFRHGGDGSVALTDGVADVVMAEARLSPVLDLLRGGAPVFLELGTARASLRASGGEPPGTGFPPTFD